MLIRKTLFWISVILAIGVLAFIFALTEQNPVQTSTLSSAVNDAIVAQHDCEAGDVPRPFPILTPLYLQVPSLVLGR